MEPSHSPPTFATLVPAPTMQPHPSTTTTNQPQTTNQVTGMARQMVINYGMSDIGPWSLLDPSAQSGDVVMRMMARNSMSENLQQRIDDAVKKIAADAYEVALKHIRENRWVYLWVCGATVLQKCLRGCDRGRLHNERHSRMSTACRW